VGTLLVTSKMHPALAARIERRISQNARRAGGARFRKARSFSLGRLAPLVALGLVVGLFVLMRKHEGGALDARRAATKTSLMTTRVALADVRPDLVSEVEEWIQKAASGALFEKGELVDERLRVPGALDEALSRPGLYVRGAKEHLSKREAIADESGHSIKDGFLLCLFDPPASQHERELLGRVRGVHFGGAMIDELTGSVRRLFELEAGARLLSTSFDAAIDAAKTAPELDRLDVIIRSVNVDAAARGGQAELLLVVIDDPPGARPTEPDNERPHPARVALIDLARREPLLLLRRPVGGAPLAKANRALYAAAADGCALALDVRAATE
jgi:hypothetical protein